MKTHEEIARELMVQSYADYIMLEQRIAAALREAQADVVRSLRCGDNSCLFGPPDGMATNGGCRCGAGSDREARRLLLTVAAKLRVFADAARKGGGV
jgi:hypothetical protein